MIDALRVWWRAFRHYNHYGYRYIWLNVAWIVFSLPIVTAPAAWAAFVTVSHALYNGQLAGFDEFRAAFKAHLKRGLLMALLNVVVIGVNVVNLASYAATSDPLVNIARAVWIVTLGVWFMAQVYLYPLWLEMQQPTLWGAFRNALVMIALNPLFTLTMLALYLIVFTIGYFFVALWMLIIGGVMVSTATGAVLDRLTRAGVRAPLPDPTSPPEVNDVDIT